MTWNLYELVAFIGDSSILKYLDKYNVRQMTRNLHEFVAIADHLSWSLSLYNIVELRTPAMPAGVGGGKQALLTPTPTRKSWHQKCLKRTNCPTSPWYIYIGSVQCFALSGLLLVFWYICLWHLFDRYFLWNIFDKYIWYRLKK